MRKWNGASNDFKDAGLKMLTQGRKICSDLKLSVASNFIRGRKSISGGTALEFAFAGPIMFLFLFGIIEFGRVMFTQGVMQYALYDASRYAAVNYAVNYNVPVAEIKKVATDRFILIDPDNVTSFTVTAVEKSDTTSLVTLEISYLFNFLVPIVATEPITLSADAKILVTL